MSIVTRRDGQYIAQRVVVALLSQVTRRDGQLFRFKRSSESFVVVIPSNAQVRSRTRSYAAQRVVAGRGGSYLAILS
ncbi:MAG: hypothetical protein JW936_08655 [Sedimentisphaerales bacterium]|nr:hypothetical protein [Sedimentisphaerales bacterium]